MAPSSRPDEAPRDARQQPEHREMPTRPELLRRATYLRDLLRELIVRDFKLRYQRSMLGITWSWLKPLSQLVVFLFLFSAVMPLSIPYYASYLFAGVLAWSWFSNAVLASATSITGNPELVRRPGFPVRVLPVLVVMNDGIHFVLALPILIAVTTWEVGFAGPLLIALPLVILVQFLFTLGLCYWIAACHVRFRDTQDAVGILTMVAFYLTPIFYQASSLHDGYEAINRFNPMSQIIGGYRAILIEHRLPDMMGLYIVALVSLVLIVGGERFFSRLRATFVEEL